LARGRGVDESSSFSTGVPQPGHMIAKIPKAI
jgi:hypothetical protein